MSPYWFQVFQILVSFHLMFGKLVMVTNVEMRSLKIGDMDYGDSLICASFFSDWLYNPKPTIKNEIVELLIKARWNYFHQIIKICFQAYVPFHILLISLSINLHWYWIIQLRKYKQVLKLLMVFHNLEKRYTIYNLNSHSHLMIYWLRKNCQALGPGLVFV